MAEIDKLEVSVKAQADSACKSLDNLIGKLGKVSDALSKISGSSFTGLADGVNTLAKGMKNLQGIKGTDFTRLANGIEKLGKINSTNLSTVGTALKPLADGVSLLSNANFDNKNLQNLTNSLTRLSNANLGSLTNVDFTKIGESIRNLASSLSGAEKVQQSTISMTNAIANLAKSGPNISTVVTELPRLGTALKEFISTMSTAPAVAGSTISFSQAIGTLASSGAKVATTSDNLSRLATELKRFMQVMASAPTVNSNVIQMTNALANLVSQGGNVRTASRSLTTGLNQTSSSMANARKQTLNLVTAFGKLYAKYFLVVRVFKKLWGSVESSMDYVETLNYFNAAFGQVADAAVTQWKEAGYSSAEEYYNSFSDRAKELTAKMTGFSVTESGKLQTTRATNLGINPEQLMNYQATFAQMSSSMGVSSENALKLSNALTEIGADLASVKNMDFDKVWTDMASGLVGMSRTLDKYGVNIRNVNLQQKLNELGIEANITALNQNEKALLRTIILLDSTRYAWGDMSNTLEQPANQLRLLKSSFSNLSRTIGNIFLPIVAKVLPYINGLVIALQRLAEKVVNLLGFEGFDWGGVGNSSFDMSQLYDDAENVADGLDDATNSAKKLNNELMGFDEINKLSDTTDSEVSALGGVGASEGLLNEALDKILSEYQSAWNDAFDNMENRANEFADRIEYIFKNKEFKELGSHISTNISRSLGSINWDSIYNSASNFGSRFADFLNGLITPDLFGNIGKTIAGYFNTEIYTALNFGQTFDFKNLGESVATGINDFFENFDFGSLAETFNIWVQGFADAFISFMSNVDWTTILKGAWNFLKEIDLDTIEIIISMLTFKVAAKVIKTAVTTKLLPLINKRFSVNSSRFLKIGIAITVATIAIKIAQDKLEPIFSEYDLEEIKEASERMFSDWFGENSISATLSDIFVFESTAIAKPSEIKDALGLLWEDVCSGDFKLNLFNLIEFPSYNEITASLSDTGKAINDWWDKDIVPWFKGETWKELWRYVKQDFIEGWDNIVSWWNSTTLVRWWSENVKPWFSKGTWLELWTNVKQDFRDGWNDIVNWWGNTAIVRWWNDHVAPWFTKGKWVSAMRGVQDAFETTWNNAISSIKEIWNTFANWLNKKLTWEIKPIKIMGKKIFDGATIDLGKIPTFATGGYPNMEKPFIVGENGAEIMGGMYGKPAVANNNSITDGIRQAAYEGMKMALSECGGGNNQNINLQIQADTDGIFKVVRKGAIDYTLRTGQAPFPT